MGLSIIRKFTNSSELLEVDLVREIHSVINGRAKENKASNAFNHNAVSNCISIMYFNIQSRAMLKSSTETEANAARIFP